MEDTLGTTGMLLHSTNWHVFPYIQWEPPLSNGYTLIDGLMLDAENDFKAKDSNIMAEIRLASSVTKSMINMMEIKGAKSRHGRWWEKAIK